jgi:hypothetical protein
VVPEAPTIASNCIALLWRNGPFGITSGGIRIAFQSANRIAPFFAALNSILDARRASGFGGACHSATRRTANIRIDGLSDCRMRRGEQRSGSKGGD